MLLRWPILAQVRAVGRVRGILFFLFLPFRFPPFSFSLTAIPLPPGGAAWPSYRKVLWDLLILAIATFRCDVAFWRIGIIEPFCFNPTVLRFILQFIRDWLAFAEDYDWAYRPCRYL